MQEACYSCGKPATSKCSKCKVVTYCSTACQKDHWPAHKLICAQPGEPDPLLSSKLVDGIPGVRTIRDYAVKSGKPCLYESNEWTPFWKGRKKEEVYLMFIDGWKMLGTSKYMSGQNIQDVLKSFNGYGSSIDHAALAPPGNAKAVLTFKSWVIAISRPRSRAMLPEWWKPEKDVPAAVQVFEKSIKDGKEGTTTLFSLQERWGEEAFPVIGQIRFAGSGCCACPQCLGRPKRY